MAVLFNELQGLNLMDIMFRLFSAFAPAIMIPLIAGLLFKKLNARGALAGMICGAITGIVLVVANLVLVQAHAAGMKLHPQLDFWLRSGWNSAATVLSVAATIVGMWLGSASKATTEDEKRRSGEFFSDLAKPFLLEEKERTGDGPAGAFPDDRFHTPRLRPGDGRRRRLHPASMIKTPGPSGSTSSSPAF